MAYTVYGKPRCQGCETVKKILSEKMCDYDYIDISHPMYASTREWLMNEGHRTVPQIYKDGKYFGDYDDFMDEINSGRI